MSLGVLLLLIGSLVGLCAGQGGLRRRVWSIYNYPNPVQDPESCGRQFPSFVCDPNNLLPENEANEIDAIIKNVYNVTTVPCYNREGSKMKGYVIMVAVMPKMQKVFTPNTSNSHESRYREGQLFAYLLAKYKWTYAQCNETTIIFYSADDGVLYTSTQALARQKLSDQLIEDVNMETLTWYYPMNSSPQRQALAIKHMARRYSDIFQDD